MRWERKHRVPDTYYTDNDYANVIKFIKITVNSTQNRQKSQKKQKYKKQFSKRIGKNADLYKPVSNKTMNTHK